jgi:hypothetical protein
VLPVGEWRSAVCAAELVVVAAAVAAVAVAAVAVAENITCVVSFCFPSSG